MEGARKSFSEVINMGKYSDMEDLYQNQLYAEKIDALEKVEITKETLPFYLYVFEKIVEPHVSNILAYKFEDIQDDRVIPYLIGHLEDPKTYAFRGNVLSALGAYDYRPYADLLIQLTKPMNNYEVRNKAAFMLSEISQDLTDAQRTAWLHQIKAFETNLKDMLETLDMLSEEIFSSDE